MNKIQNNISSFPNRDLEVIGDNKARWCHPPFRRYSFQNLNRINRYALTFRSAQVMALTPAEDPRIGKLAKVQSLINHPYFTAICVVRDGKILFERIAPDFRNDQLHAIQSITKTFVNLLYGNLVASGKIKLDALVTDYIPEVIKGYRGATVQQALNMDVENDYTEQFEKPEALVYEHEEALGWRIPRDPENEESQKQFLARIGHNNLLPPSPLVKYKSSNTDILAWIIERVTGTPLRNHIADVIDAAGIENQFSISCDRDGFPIMDGGGCFSIRDLVRYGSIFVRDGVGVNGAQIGNSDWIQKTITGGIKWEDLDESIEGNYFRYSNQCDSDSRAIAHGGYCGQYLYMDCTSRTVVGFYSVTDQKDGICLEHFNNIWYMMREVTRLDG